MKVQHSFIIDITMVAKVYSIQVQNIKCTNCAAKIENGLPSALAPEKVKVSVNVMQEKVNLTLEK